MPLAIYDFEKPVAELEKQIHELETNTTPTPQQEQQLQELAEQLEEAKKQVYGQLSPWQRVQLARHLARPHSLDYIHALFSAWTELHGDRAFADDPALVCGFSFFEDTPVCVIGQQKGKDAKENVARNFGMLHPEGYRKALRIMKLADKFHLPIIIFIDTPGAFPGIGAEERGQAEAIARNIKEMFTLQVPIIVVVIGEGGSGGALGVGLGDVALMLENAWYCVISPEGCASILWRSKEKAPESAEALKLTAQDLVKVGVVDEIIAEPLGGAHWDPQQVYERVRDALRRHLPLLRELPREELIQRRYEKYRKLGVVVEPSPSAGQ